MHAHKHAANAFACSFSPPRLRTQAFDRGGVKGDATQVQCYASRRSYHGQRCVFRVLFCRFRYASFPLSRTHSAPPICAIPLHVFASPSFQSSSLRCRCRRHGNRISLFFQSGRFSCNPRLLCCCSSAVDSSLTFQRSLLSVPRKAPAKAGIDCLHALRQDG